MDTTRSRAWLRSLCVLTIAALLLPGCRTARDNQIEILERELRTQEDYIYELEDYVIQYSEKLRSMRCAQAIEIKSEPRSKNSVVKKLKSDDRPKLRDDRRRDEDEPREGLPEPKTPDVDSEEEFDLEEYEPPPLEIEQPLGKMQVGTTDGLALLDEEPEAAPVADRELTFPSPVDYAETESEPEEISRIERVVYQEDLFGDQDLVPADYEVATDELPASGETPVRIVVKQLFRGDDPGTPQRLLAVIEGRDEENDPIEFTGEVSLMIMVSDPKRPLRLKRWDFFPSDVSAAWQSSHLGDGLHLELPLEDTELPNVPLELWVRLIDGQRNKTLSQKSFSLTQLAGLEVETGAKQLQPETAPKSAEKTLVKASSQDSPQSANSGWRSSTQSTAGNADEFSGSLRKAGGWTAQTTSGNVASTVKPTAANEPSWTAGRIRRVNSQSLK